MVPFNKYFIGLTFVLVLMNCKPKNSTMQMNNSIPNSFLFKSFYEKFHTDSIYQLNHIRFPLEGEPDQSDTIAYKETFYWYPDQWVTHHTFNNSDTSFVRSFIQVDTSLIIEKIKHKLSPLSMERRWSRNDTFWELIYYSPLRTPVKIEIN